jgi:hypothetical protein
MLDLRTKHGPGRSCLILGEGATQNYCIAGNVKILIIALFHIKHIFELIVEPKSNDKEVIQKLDSVV